MTGTVGMDGVRWYLKGLAQQPAPPLAPMFTVPEVTAIEGPLARVQLAAQRYHLTATCALSDEHRMLIRAWGERQKRILAWLQVLDAGDDLDSAAAALPAVPAVGGAMWGHSATTVFDELQELASAEARVHTDYANLQRAIAFYMAAVDVAVKQAAVLLRHVRHCGGEAAVRRQRYHRDRALHASDRRDPPGACRIR
ncbi:MAG: hypothetical protein SV966_01355 [Actinomycetota bacterium]|nr:hypothetical protein [Actinomycetota bacterium]